MINLGFKIIDLHAHFRDKIPFHTKIAYNTGISQALYMPNTQPCLDNVRDIKKSLKQKRYIKAIPVSAITIGRKGKKLVDIEKIRSYVAGFSDDGNCLMDLDLLAKILKTGVLVMAHLEPETEMAEKYLRVLSKVGGKLHLQHISCASTINIIRKFKSASQRSGLEFTCESCPHYFTFPNEIENHPINPPLGNLKDIEAVKKALADGTIDCIASDYAPIPRSKGTGMASYFAFLALSYGLVLDKTLTKQQLKEKLNSNPLKIFQS
jgi:dihydroorotase